MWTILIGNSDDELEREAFPTAREAIAAWQEWVRFLREQGAELSGDGRCRTVRMGGQVYLLRLVLA